MSYIATCENVIVTWHPDSEETTEEECFNAAQWAIVYTHGPEIWLSLHCNDCSEDVVEDYLVERRRFIKLSEYRK